MYDLYDVATADCLAGGPRDDLDDVVVEHPCTIGPHTAAPGNGDVLAMFVDLATQVEQRWLFDKFYETSEARGSVEKFAKYATTQPSCVGLGNIDAANMFCRYGLWLYTRNPYLTKMDCLREMWSMGYKNSRAAWFKWLERNADTANTARTRFASAASGQAA